MKLKLKSTRRRSRSFCSRTWRRSFLGSSSHFPVMLYSALSTAGRFDKTPERLQTAVAAGSEEIESTRPDPTWSWPTTSARPSEAAFTSRRNRTATRSIGTRRCSRAPVARRPAAVCGAEACGSPGWRFRLAPPARGSRSPYHFRFETVFTLRAGELGGNKNYTGPKPVGGEEIRGQRWIVDRPDHDRETRGPLRRYVQQC